MATVTLRSVKGSALTFTEMDNNFNNLNTDKIELTDLSVGTEGTPSGDGSIAYNNTTGVFTYTPPTAAGIGAIALTALSVGAEAAASGDGGIAYDNSTGVFTYTPPTAAGIGAIGLTALSVGAEAAASGDGAIAYDNSTGVFTYTPPTAAGIGALANVGDDSFPQLGGNLDIQSYTITTTTSNGSILLQPNGTGFVTVDGGTGLAVDTGFIKANNTNANLTLQADGIGYILLNQVGGVIVTDTAASGNGVITGATSKGIALLTNAGASGVNDPQFALSNGGGISVSPGATSTTTFNGTNVSNLQLKDYKETVYTGGTTTGTITPDVANGNVQSITLSGNITFSAFGNPEAGQSMTLIVKQPSSGGPYTLTSTMKFAGGTKTLSTAADAIDIISVFYDGTDYWASLATAFA